MCDLPLPEHGKFFDLNMSFEESVSTVAKRLTMLVYLGYEVIALTRFVSSTGKPSGKSKKKILLPSPPEKVTLEEEAVGMLDAKNAKLMQFTRITIELNELDDLAKVREVLTSGTFDIVAVLPRTEKLFHTSCTELNIDIICIDGSDKLAFTPKHNPIKAAITRGIFFEVCYSPMIRNTTVRRLTITNVQRFVEFSRGKNVIMSSAAMIPMELRGPYDVANMTSLFGLPKQSSIHALSKNCRSCVVHGFARKTAKSAVFVQKRTPDDVKLTSQPVDTKFVDVILQNDGCVTDSTPPKKKRKK